MPQFTRSHILLEGFTQTLPFTSNQRGSGIEVKSGVSPKTQGKKVRKEFKDAVETFSNDRDIDFVYVTFVSAYDFLLDIDKFNDVDGNFRLASYKEIQSFDDEGGEHKQIEATVWLNKTAVSKFLKKVRQYIYGRTPKNKVPFHQSLIANISEIRAATLQSFWQEPELPFPNKDESVWWEVWFSHDGTLMTHEELTRILDNNEIQIGARELFFPEHQVFIIRAKASQLEETLLYSDRLSELRKPVETTDFFTKLDRQEQLEWIEDLRNRVVNRKAENAISVCLLDTGVNRAHPLLTDLIDASEMDSVQPAWSTADTDPQGHGTPMAGLSFYGDLSEALATTQVIEVYHYLESIKLIEKGQPHRPELYGSVTQEAVARAVVIHPHHKRIVCLSVTSDKTDHKGRPSSWSSAIDQMLYHSTGPDADPSICFVSSGNVPFEEWATYPLSNDDISIHDPGQSFNSITVGAYSLKDSFDSNRYPNAELLASRGQMSPCNSTSIGWDREWSKKPDIVMEGGNAAIDKNAILDFESLQLLSTGKGGPGRHLLTSFGDTSGATALASKFAADLWFHYPQYWPETIRALIIHSASWTKGMLCNHRITDLVPAEKRKLVSRVGYGVPNLQRAKYSANNSLTLIAQRTLKPFKKDESKIKTDEFHLFELPWPVEVLSGLLNQEVQLVVTLSYFIEPSPGTRQYQKAASYRSCGLRFKMIDKNESSDKFKARVSKAMKEENYQKEGDEHWILGSSVRDKGSIHKDGWIGEAADLALKNKIAVYPVGGWWRTRKVRERYNDTIRYSLVVSIVTPDIDVDIYTPVQQLIPVPIEPSPGS